MAKPKRGEETIARTITFPKAIWEALGRKAAKESKVLNKPVRDIDLVLQSVMDYLIQENEPFIVEESHDQKEDN